MQLVDRLGGELPRGPVTVELDDIQATVLRYRPEPYYGTHVMLHVRGCAGRPRIRAEADAACRLRRRVVAGRRGLDLDRHQLHRAGGAGPAGGLAARASPKHSAWGWPHAPTSSGTTGRTIPKNWEQPFGTGEIHIAVSVFSDSEDKLAPDAMETARQQYQGFSGVTVLMMQDFGAQPGDLNPLGYKDSIGQPAIEGSGVEPLPGQGRPIKAGEFILGYPGEAGVPLPMPRPDVLGRNGTFVGLRKYQSRVGTFNRFLREHAGTEQERELLAAKLVGRWRSGAPLDARARRTTTRRWARTRAGTTTSPMPPIRTAGRCRSARTCGA